MALRRTVGEKQYRARGSCWFAASARWDDLRDPACRLAPAAAGWYFPLLSCLFKKLQIWSVGRRWLSLAVKPLSFPSLHRRSWRRWSLVGRSSTRCWSPPRPFWLSTPSRNRRRPWPTGKVLHTSDSVPTANICLIRRLTRVNARVHGVGAVPVKLDLIRCIICCRTSGKASVCRLITQDLSTQINIQPHWFSPLWCVV